MLRRPLAGLAAAALGRAPSDGEWWPVREGRSVWVRAGPGGPSRGPPRPRAYKQAFAFSLLPAPGTPLPACLRLRQGFLGLARRRVPASKTEDTRTDRVARFFMQVN